MDGNSFPLSSRRTFASLAAKLALGAGSTALFPPKQAQAIDKSKRIAPGIYVHQGVHAQINPKNRGHIANVGWIIGDEAVAVVDTGSTAAFGHEIRRMIQAVTDLPIRYVIATHVHPDHLFGHAAFLEDRPAFIGHRKLRSALEQRGRFYLDNLLETMGILAKGTEIVFPDLLVDEMMEIDLGNRRLTLRAHKTAHTDNDLTIFDLTSGVLFAGDLLFMERCPVLDGSLLGWLEVMADLQRLRAITVVPGHGPAMASIPGAFEAQARYLTKLRDSVRAFLDENGLLEDAVRALPHESERSRWALFDETHGRNVSAAYAELEWE